MTSICNFLQTGVTSSYIEVVWLRYVAGIVRKSNRLEMKCMKRLGRGEEANFIDKEQD
jgi:hypothetical protein